MGHTILLTARTVLVTGHKILLTARTVLVTSQPTKPEPKNNDELKDDMSLWMFLMNNLWIIVFLAIMIIIVVYVYMTFQERRESIQNSLF